MNPYKAPSTPLLTTVPPTRPIGPILIALVLVVAAVVGFTSTHIPSVRAVTMPRFGWGGLISCLNPLIFLLPWLCQPKWTTLLGAAFMSFTMGLINAVELSSVTTVSTVGNEFHDRLHSSWLWSVLPFFAIGVYLSWISISTLWNSGVAIKGESGKGGHR